VAEADQFQEAAEHGDYPSQRSISVLAIPN
jgi:hypothetical protein